VVSKAVRWRNENYLFLEERPLKLAHPAQP